MVVERLRRDTRLYLPALSSRRGFSSSRVEHLLNGLVREMPADECYLEIGTLEGRTLDSASVENPTKRLVGVDPCLKYDTHPDAFFPNVHFMAKRWQDLRREDFTFSVGVLFYDGDHSAGETHHFMNFILPFLAKEAVLVLDDWDRESVRDGAYMCGDYGEVGWRLLREMPEYTDGLTTAPHHFGYTFGVALWGYRR